jgi:preprotein translocase subunit SecY
MNIELARRIAFTIGALLIFRFGSHLPLTGISIQSASFTSVSPRVSVLALNLFPYLSAALVIQLISMVWKRFGSLARDGEAGRRKIVRYTLVLTLLLATFQAWGIASALQNISGLVVEPGDWFLLSATVSMVGGVFFLVWLSDQITRYGVGNGIALLVVVPILISFPPDAAKIIELMRDGVASANLTLFNALFCVAVIALVVFVESARRNVPLEFAARQVGKRLLPPQSAVLPIKINSAGYLLPVTVAPWLIYAPFALAGLVFDSPAPWLAAAYRHALAPPIYLPVISVAMFVLAFIYTAYVVDPEQAAEKLAKRGGAIPGVEPGEPTADCLDRVVSFTTVLGAVYLVSLMIIPQVLVLYGKVFTSNISGGAALIVVCTVLDLKMQVRELSLTNSGGARQ